MLRIRVERTSSFTTKGLLACDSRENLTPEAEGEYEVFVNARVSCMDKVPNVGALMGSRDVLFLSSHADMSIGNPGYYGHH